MNLLPPAGYTEVISSRMDFTPNNITTNRTTIPSSSIKAIDPSSVNRPASSPGSVRLYEKAKLLEVSIF